MPLRPSLNSFSIRFWYIDTCQVRPCGTLRPILPSRHNGAFQIQSHQYEGIGGVGVCSSLRTQKVAGSNPVATNPNRSALRSQLRWVHAISFGRLSRMIRKLWLRHKWGGSLLKDLESCKSILLRSYKNLGEYQIPKRRTTITAAE